MKPFKVNGDWLVPKKRAGKRGLYHGNPSVWTNLAGNGHDQKSEIDAMLVFVCSFPNLWFYSLRYLLQDLGASHMPENVELD